MTTNTGFATSPKKGCPSCGMLLEAQATVCPRDGTSLATTINTDPAFHKFEFEESIGSGGMGIIYKARHLMLNKVMAIKTMHSHLSSPETIRRFQIEGKATSSLSHPNIIAVHDFGVTQSGQPFMIMDFVNGETLSDVLRLNGQLPVPRFYNIFIQVCDALSHAHSRSVLHRDIKPSNIMIVRNERGEDDVRIMDFGIAKILSDTDDSARHLTKTGDAIGSPAYMSPEQARGSKIDCCSDLYSLGCVMYECLTGSPPFEGKAPFETLLMHMESKPLSFKEASMGSEIDQRLEKIVMRLLEKDPSDRYQSMDELKRDLVFLSASKTKAGKLPSGTDVQRHDQSGKSRNPVTLIAALALSFLLLAAIVTALFLWKSGGKASSAVEPKLEAFPTSFVRSEAMQVPEFFNRMVLQDGTIIDTGGLTRIGGFTVSDSDLKRFQDLKLKTKIFLLPFTEVTDVGLSYLNRLDLTRLNVSHSRVKTLDGISHMQNLRELEAAATPLVSGSAFQNIAGCKRLQRLDLNETAVQPSDLKLLASLPLTTLEIRDTNLPIDAVDDYIQAHPLCHVFFSPLEEASVQTPWLKPPRIIEGSRDALIGRANRLFQGGEFAKANLAYYDAAQVCRKAKAYDEMIACEFSRADCLRLLGKPFAAHRAMESGMMELFNLKDGYADAWKTNYYYRLANIEEDFPERIKQDITIFNRASAERRFITIAPQSFLAKDYEQNHRKNLALLVRDLRRRAHPQDLKAADEIEGLIGTKEKIAKTVWNEALMRALEPYPEPAKRQFRNPDEKNKD